jgi:hypothetical protein
MKYFIDTEFIEGFHKPLFGKLRHFIDLISIGIVCDDGREYYAISNEFNSKDADKWVIHNVISKLPDRHADQFDSPRVRREAALWKSNAAIRQDLFDFITYGHHQNHLMPDGGPNLIGHDGSALEFYGYYADYDWVLFCSLFGRMINLPKGFPMYCRDLKQMMDEKRLDKKWKKENCPDPEGAHDALVDAKWNKKLFDLLSTI